MGLDVGLIVVGLIVGRTVGAPVIRVVDWFPYIEVGPLVKGCNVGPRVVGPETIGCKVVGFGEAYGVAETVPSGVGHTSSFGQGT